MKKARLLVLAFSALLICTSSGCGNNPPAASPAVTITAQTPSVPSPVLPIASASAASDTGTPAPASSGASAAGIRTGLGTDVSVDKSASAMKDAQGKNVDALARTDCLMAAVTLDAGGRIVGIRMDGAEVKITFDASGKLTADTGVKPRTKAEQGDAYGMKKASAIGREWYQQIDSLGKWMVGKTPDQVMAMKTYKKDDDHPNVPQEPDLAASATISVEGFQKAVQKAALSARDFKAAPIGNTKTGLGTDISTDKSVSAGKGTGSNAANALGEADITIAAVTVDSQGKIVGAILDGIQTKVNFSPNGKLATDTAVKPRTKDELGDAYGMKQGSSIGMEWYRQADAFAKWMIGKTIEQVQAVKTYKKDATHPNVPQEPDLTSSVTISVDGFLAAVKKAVANAK
jgi:hypothetical protein